MEKRRMQHSISSLSLDSTSTNNENGLDVQLPIPANNTECNDEITKYQSELEASTEELGILSQNVKELRRQKEPLMKIKDVLQKEITKSNEIINTKSEEVTKLKNKLRHHSEKQIQNNIERLEYQLRINNYKPKEEQKILDEISMLQRSSKTLKDYNLKELENKKYRSERNRLIEQRNEIYENIHTVYGREEKEKREVNKKRKRLAEITIIIDHLINCRAEFESAKLEEKRQKDALVKKKLEEKAQSKKEQYLKRQEDRRKLWEEYEASREPFEEEKAICRVLIAYMEKLILPSDKIPLSNGQDIMESKVTLNRSQTLPPKSVAEPTLNLQKSTPFFEKLDGTFYSKQKSEDSGAANRRLSKKDKAKAKKDLKSNKSKVLSHPPEVLADLLKMNLPIPKTSDLVPNVLDSLKSTLNSYYVSSKPVLVVDNLPNINSSCSNDQECSNNSLNEINALINQSRPDETNSVIDCTYKCQNKSILNGIVAAVTIKEVDYPESSINAVSSVTMR